MPTIETLESLQEALAPLEVLHHEQAELGSWIHDSFSALEKLHQELTQWQSELARKETELDLRQDALGKTAAPEKARTRSASDGEEWKGEFRALRVELERYYQQLSEQLERVAAGAHLVGHDAYTPLSAGAAHAKSAELRRRAQSRREAKERKDP